MVMLEEKRLNIKIQRSLNEGEYKVRASPGRNYSLDGFYADPVTGEKTCLEFQECAFHGCETCYPDQIAVHPFYTQCLKDVFLLRKRWNI